jgi:CBS domain-containing protein
LGSASEAVKIVFLLLAASAAFQSPTHSYWCPAPNLLLPSENHPKAQIACRELAMRVFDPVSLILCKKGNDIWSVPSDTTVYSAVKLMADKDVGALLVMEGNKFVGMISERDYARKVILMGRSSKDTPVSEILTEPLITIRPECSVDEAMRLITTNRIRHLPVVCDGIVEGVISIGDLVQWIAFAQDQTIEELQHYIEGKYPC